ncbi:MAG TPA: hypothetical protein VFP34_16270 [Microlunatus sp.]|nr:hypothetical protein [Microlunatus sp.]
MSAVEIVGLAVIVLLVVGWRLSWLATRLDRAHTRVERRWAALDAALVRRAQAALEAARSGSIDPASMLLVCDAAAAALEPDLDPAAREQAESDLSRVLALVSLPAVEPYAERAELARRLHNDAVVSAVRLRRGRTVTLFRLTGHATEPRAFEMAAKGQLTWPRGFVG